MIILVINQFGIPAIKTECQPPVSIDPDRPVAGQASTQFMQSPIRRIQICRPGCVVQCGKLKLQPCRMMRLDALLATHPEKRFKPLMPERFNHDELLTVKPRLSIRADMKKPGISPAWVLGCMLFMPNLHGLLFYCNHPSSP